MLYRCFNYNRTRSKWLPPLGKLISPVISSNYTVHGCFVRYFTLFLSSRSEIEQEPELKRIDKLKRHGRASDKSRGNKVGQKSTFQLGWWNGDSGRGQRLTATPRLKVTALPCRDTPVNALTLDAAVLNGASLPDSTKRNTNEQPGLRKPRWKRLNREPKAVYLSTCRSRFVLCTSSLGEAQTSTMECKRGRRAFPALFAALHLAARPPPIRFPFIATRRGKAVYVFAATRSKEATSSFTLEMKALHRRTGGRKGAWEWFFYWNVL